MKLSPEKKLCLEELYCHYTTATDQLKRSPVVLSRITAAFNNMTGCDFDSGTLLRYMVNRRKNKDWPCLGDRAQRLAPLTSVLTETQLTILEAIYVERDVTSDEYLFNPAFAKALVNEFAKRAGVIVPAATLISVIFAKRKRGDWVCIREEVADENKAAAKAFSDMEEADRIFKQKHKNA
jgi:hypothetical protein